MSGLQLYIQQGSVGNFWYDNFKQVPATAAGILTEINWKPCTG